MIIIKDNYAIYMHISPTNKRYIGITYQKPKRRWQNGKGYKNQKYFYRAIEKYGWDNFEHIIIAKGLDEETAKWLEIELIREWDTTDPNKGYNLTLGGEGANGLFGELNGMFGKQHTKETKEKISKSNKGKKRPNFKRKKHTEEWKQEQSEKMSGESNPKAQEVILLNTKEVFSTIIEGEKKYNICGISDCCRGGTNLCGRLKDGTPLVWMYYDDYLNLTEEEVQEKIRNADTRIILLNTKEIFLTQLEGANKYGTYQQHISKCCNGKVRSAGKHPITGEKLVWMFYKDYLKLVNK